MAGFPAAAEASLSTHDTTPFPPSARIVGAQWTSPMYGPPSRQRGDILPTIWADDGNQYAMVDDGGAGLGSSTAFWRNSLAEVIGSPPHIRIAHVGDPTQPPPATSAQIRRRPSLWTGPLGPYYSSGLVEAKGVFYATEQRRWNSGMNAPFTGLQAIAYSTDHGESWTSGARSFPAPLGNLSWVIRGKGGFYADGYVYAIASEREFNADHLILGRARPGPATMTDPAAWQWTSGFTGAPAERTPTWSSSSSAAAPIATWSQHITYPQMAYDSPLHRYLLTFTYSYKETVPGIWQDGAQLVILDAPHPWGPFSFVAQEPNFGPSDGYAPGIPLAWISRDGHSLWMKWSANFDGCAPGLDCSGAYGFNYRRLHLTVAAAH